MIAIAIGSDHAGLSLKEEIVRFLQEEKWEVMDVGTHDLNPVDYPDIARDVGAALLDGRSKKGILICGSGVGASVAANKLRGIRAGLCQDTYSARQGVEHDDMNVLCLGARVVGTEVAKELVSAFLKARFSGAERHVRRLNKVNQLEKTAGIG
jgi:ribose 5-phosphate isomerase B